MKKILVVLILTILLRKKRLPKRRGLLRLKRDSQSIKRQIRSPKKSQRTSLIEQDY
jgi:hypothetical protein